MRRRIRAGAAAIGLTALAAGILLASLAPPGAANSGWRLPRFALAAVDAKDPYGGFGYQDLSGYCLECALNGGRYPYTPWDQPPAYEVGVGKSGDVYVAEVASGSIRLRWYSPDLRRRLGARRAAFRGWDAGRVTFAPDGYLYAMVGRPNYKEMNGRVVVKVIRYDLRLREKGTATLRSGQVDGVYQPLHASSGSIAVRGRTLIGAFGRELYADSQGTHHQSGAVFRVDLDTMKTTGLDGPTISHQFNEFVRFASGDRFAMGLHGDAGPRSIAFGSGAVDGSTSTVRDLIALKGPLGQNFTGTTLNGFEVGAGRAVAVGLSVPHGHPVKGVRGISRRFLPNAYVVTKSLSGGDVGFRWLTKLNPRSTKTIVGQPTLTPLGKGRFAILFNVSTGKPTRNSDYYRRANKTRYLLINAQGRTLASKSWKGRAFKPLAAPVLIKGRLVWVGLHSNSDTVANSPKGGHYLTALRVGNPRDPKFATR